MTVEEERDMYRNMVKLYKFDHLTGVKMRRDFEVETRHKMKAQNFYLVMYDVVGLHKVNREQGVAAGDALVKQVVSDIQAQPSLWEVYRVGGDEFMALHFEQPIGDVDNATSGYVYSACYGTLGEMVEGVDKLVTQKKAKLNRRRED